MMFEPFKPFLASAYQIKFATEAWEKRRAPRRCAAQVFCGEQGLFDGDDRDAIDEIAIPIVAISLFGMAADEVVGTVRIHRSRRPGIWWGSRLAVTGQYRRRRRGRRGLIRLAVASAHARGCQTFLANVQHQNVTLFRRLTGPRWRRWSSTASRIACARISTSIRHSPRPKRFSVPAGMAAMTGALTYPRWRGIAGSSRHGRQKRHREVAKRLGMSGDDAMPVGDDCAAIPDGDGYLLFAIEGFMNEFVAGDPWFAGWCGVMVNIADVAAMGGRPVAVVDAVWANGDAGRAGAGRPAGRRRGFAVPVVGGHTNLRNKQGQLAVAVLGRAKKLLTSFDAKPGEILVAAMDLRGQYREPFSNWKAATGAACAAARRYRNAARDRRSRACRGGQGYQPGRHRRDRGDAGRMFRRGNRHRPPRDSEAC